MFDFCRAGNEIIQSEILLGDSVRLSMYQEKMAINKTNRIFDFVVLVKIDSGEGRIFTDEL